MSMYMCVCIMYCIGDQVKLLSCKATEDGGGIYNVINLRTNASGSCPTDILDFAGLCSCFYSNTVLVRLINSNNIIESPLIR